MAGNKKAVSAKKPAVKNETSEPVQPPVNMKEALLKTECLEIQDLRVILVFFDAYLRSETITHREYEVLFPHVSKLANEVRIQDAKLTS